MVLIFESVEGTWRCDHSNERKEQYFPLVLFIILNNVVLTFASVDEILDC